MRNHGSLFMRTLSGMIYLSAAVLIAAGTLCLGAEGSPVPAGLVERYGDAAADMQTIEAALVALRSGHRVAQDRAEWEEAMERLASRPLEGRGLADRVRLANAWSRMALLVRHLDGPTSQYLDLLEVAHGLNPQDEALRREVDYQRTRKAIAQERTQEAARIRAAREAGRDIESERPYVGGAFEQPSGD